MPSNHQEPRSRHQAGGDNGIPVHGKPSNIRPLPNNDQKNVERPTGMRAGDRFRSEDTYLTEEADPLFEDLEAENKRLRELLERSYDYVKFEDDDETLRSGPHEIALVKEIDAALTKETTNAGA